MCSFDASKCVNLRRSFGWGSPGSYSCVRRRPSRRRTWRGVAVPAALRVTTDGILTHLLGDDAVMTLFLFFAYVPRYVSVRKFVISLIGSSENHTWKVHECTSKGLHKKLFLPNQDEAAQFIFCTCSIFLTLKDAVGGLKVPTGQEIVCHFSQDHARVTKILDFIHKHLT